MKFRIRSSNLTVSVLLLTCSVSALGSPDEQQTTSQKQIDNAISALVRMTDPDSLAAAGLMTGKGSAESLSLIARAAAAAPERPDIVWLQSLRCGQVPSCDPLPIEQRLRELDPTNGVGWWAAMTRAGITHDTEGTNATLAAIGHSERVDIYWITLIAHLSRAVAQTKKMSLEEAAVTVIGYLAAEAIPPYQYISASCKGDRLQQPGVTEVCRGVAKALQNGDTYITEMIGVAIAKRVWPEDSPEWKAAAEDRRVYDYRSKLFVEMSDRLTKHPEEYLTLCEQNRREKDLFAAQLIAAGYDPNPPPQS